MYSISKRWTQPLSTTDVRKRQFADVIAAREASLFESQKRPKTLSLFQPASQTLPLDEFDQVDELLALQVEDVVPSNNALKDTSVHHQVGISSTAEEILQKGVPARGKDLLPRKTYIPPARLVTDIVGCSFEVTSANGDRVYCSRTEQTHSRDDGEALDGSSATMMAMLRNSRSGLLMEDFAKLVEDVEMKTFQRVLAESGKDVKDTNNGRCITTDVSGQHQQEGSSLWVSKYAPASFLDLLSDEYINREVVRWLKMWNPCVFNTAPPPPPPQRFKTTPQGNRDAYKQQKKKDPLNRPDKLIILLAGPPGYGKTTLAHIAARHCGYKPVEINASDDRTASTLVSKVNDAVQMQAVIGEKKPNCVIIDEIDGAAGGRDGQSAIQALIKIITAEVGSSHGYSDGGGGGGGGTEEEDSEKIKEDQTPNKKSPFAHSSLSSTRNKKRSKPLLRPIIAICNDLYAPALRGLREIAKVYHFRRPSAERLAQRLQTICSREGLHCEKSTLRCLGDRSDCDVRTCLNTLQFLARKGHTSIKAADIESMKIGQKDVTKGAFTVWNELLHRTKKRGRVRESESERAMRLYGVLEDFGSHELVMMGMFENLPGLRYFDIGLSTTASLLEQLAVADCFLKESYKSSGDFAVMKYVPGPLVSFSMSAATPQQPTINWPRVISEAKRRHQGANALLHSWSLRVSPSVYVSHGGPSVLVQDCLPALLHITAPYLRPISFQLYSPEERSAVAKAVDIMLAYGLRYGLEAEAGDAGDQSIFATCKDPPLSFRPSVHTLVTYEGWTGCDRRTLSFAVRQAINHEADMEGIRRLDHSRGGSQLLAQAAPMHVDAPVNRLQLTIAQRLKEAGVTCRGEVPRKGNWLDQLKNSQHKKSNQEIIRGSSLPVLYRFHEGYTNAVKRPVLTRELL